jgi:hypothetical protein
LVAFKPGSWDAPKSAHPCAGSRGDVLSPHGPTFNRTQINNPPGVIDDQAVAEQRRPVQLAHQRLRELVEGVRQDDHLEAFAQPVDELDCSGQRCQRCYHFLYVADLQTVLIQQCQSLAHQHVVVGDIARRGA